MKEWKVLFEIQYAHESKVSEYTLLLILANYCIELVIRHAQVVLAGRQFCAPSVKLHKNTADFCPEPSLLLNGNCAIIKVLNRKGDRSYGKGIASRIIGKRILPHQSPQREGAGSKELQHGERRCDPPVGLRRPSVAAVEIRRCRRGPLAHPEPFYRQDDRSGAGRRCGRHLAAPVGPHQRAEPVLGAGTHPQRSHPHPQRAGRQVH